MSHARNLLAAALTLSLASISAAHAAGRSDLVLAALEAGRADYNPGELLVQYSAGAERSTRDAVLAGLDARIEEVVREGSSGQGALELVKLPPGLEVAAAVRALDGVKGIEFVEPNWVYHHQLSSNDTYY